MIQQKCTIEYYPKLNPNPDILDAGNYVLLGNFHYLGIIFVKER